MANYFTQHHFSPRWSSPSHHDSPAEHLNSKSTQSETSSNNHAKNNSHHHRHPGHMQEAVSRFVQALNFHYGPDDYDVVHPHFDMVETKTCYAIYGELPGLGREDISVEANDHLFTLTISGELKRPALKEVNGTTKGNSADNEGVGIWHLKAKQTEPEGAEANNTSNSAPETEAEAATQPEQPKKSTEMEAETTTRKHEPKTEQKEKDTNKKEDEIHWHVKERKIGHFKRVFRFPVDLVEMANIKANVHHGLLCVIVPKRDDLEAYNKKVEEARKVDVFQGGPDQTYPLFGYFF